jgi:parvulin-like peptidyl-prolyl isomerase
LLGAAPIQRFGLLVFGAGFLILFATLAIAEGIGPPSLAPGEVALVEGVPGRAGQITERQLDAGLEQVLAQSGQEDAAPGSEAHEQAQDEAMDRLLKAAWVRGEAAERGIAVSPARLGVAIDEFKKSQRYGTEAEFERFLAAQHLSEAEFESVARLQVLSGEVQEDVLAALPPPSPADVERYYEAAKALQFTTAPSYDVRLILNFDRAKVERARAILERNDSPASWKRLVRRYSEDPPGKRSGGLHRAIPAEFGEPLDAAIAAAPQGELLGPIETKGVYFVFSVEGSTPSEVEALGEVRQNVVNALAKREGEAAVESFASEFDGKWESRTHCAAGYEVAGCSNYRGTGRPPNAPTACYEAHPRAGIAAPSCPAPVTQAVPAMPGSVSVLSPEGTALAQRPRPTEGG